MVQSASCTDKTDGHYDNSRSICKPRKIQTICCS